MPSVERSETIFALSSGRLPAGLAVLRISGPDAFSTVRTLTGVLPKPRRMALASIRSRSGDLLDRGMVVIFPAPRSFTGEDCAELHLHGGRAVVAAVARELAAIPGLRAAEAGEFTLRAFRHGKVDLTTAEALADLIDAETEAQRRFALDNSGGRNALLYESWRATLMNCRALIEAELDFPEEDDIPSSVSDQVWSSIASLTDEIASHVDEYHRSEIIREGYRVAIIGPPNVGKSSLLNSLAGRDVAIVSDEPGTTRDLIEVALDLNGLKVILTDTAGLREGAGPVERQGMERARTAAERADLVLMIDDGSGGVEIDNPAPGRPFIRARSKIDLLGARDSRETSIVLGFSTVTGEGVSDLVSHIAARASAAAGGSSDVLPFRERHVAQLNAALMTLRQFLGMESAPLELAAEQLRLASDDLGRIVGAIDVEDLLDVVFSRFCIGK